MSVEEFTDQMTNLDDIAQQTGISVEAAQKNLTGLIDQIGQVGGSEAAGQAAANFPGLAEIFKGLPIAQRGEIGTFISGALPAAAAMFGGVPTMFGNSAEVQKNAGVYLDKLIDFLYDIYKGSGLPNVEMFAQYLASSPLAQQFLPGFQGVDEIETFLKRAFKMKESGKSFQDQIAESRAKTAIHDARENLERRRGGLFNTGFLGHMPGADRLGIEQHGNLDVGSQKRYLQDLHESLAQSGVSPEKIADILRPLRQVTFSGKLSSEERTAQFAERQTGVERNAEQAIKISLTPEASRFLNVQNIGRNNYLFGANGSQYTQPMPPVGG